jgi:hypothetical protein
MAITKPAKNLAGGTSPPAIGPQVAFAGAVVIALTPLALSGSVVPHDLVLPATCTLFLVLAALVAICAWRTRCVAAAERVTYWDVAGALTLIGFWAAAMIDPDQMVRIVEGVHRDN